MKEHPKVPRCPEADILSDRIAIIAEGHLTAIASSMALKLLGIPQRFIAVIA